MMRLPPKTQWLPSLLLLWAIPLSVLSQSIDRQVIGTSGTQVAAGSVALDYTVGEAIVETLAGPGLLLTQGFHQPLMDSVVYTVPLRGDFSLRIFPNPFTNHITLAPEGVGYEGWLAATLYDMNGRAVYTQRLLMPETHTLWLPDLPAGTYALHLRDRQGHMLWTGTLLCAH